MVMGNFLHELRFRCKVVVRWHETRCVFSMFLGVSICRLLVPRLHQFQMVLLFLAQFSRSLLSPTVSDRKLVFPSGSERFCSETLISARNAASVKSEPICEIARNFSEHIPINSEQLVGITRI